MDVTNPSGVCCLTEILALIMRIAAPTHMHAATRNNVGPHASATNSISEAEHGSSSAQSSSSMRVAVLTAFTSDYAIGHLCAPINQRYASRHVLSTSLAGRF